MNAEWGMRNAEYGQQPSAAHIPQTSVLRRPLSLRLSITDRCQLRCVYCMPREGIRKRRRDEILSFEEITRFVHVLKEHFSLSKVHITGGEPLVRAGVCDLVAMLAGEGLSDLALTTNGQSLEAMAAPLRRAGLVRVNVSLDSLDSATYAEITRGGDLGKTLAGIEEAQRAGLAPVKLNTLVLRGHNDREVTELACFALRHGCSIRFLELMPIGCARNLWKDLFVPGAEARARLEQRFTLTPLRRNRGASSRDFLAEDRHPGTARSRAVAGGLRGIIGFISSESQPFCGDCTRLRLTSAGEAISCLARGTGPRVRKFLRSSTPTDEARLIAVLAGELERKRPRERFSTKRPMSAVGG